jgi:hypothetical protein
MERLSTLMDQKEIDLIHGIEQTRTDMGNKIDMLADRLHTTIAGPKVAADHLIENLQQAQHAMQTTSPGMADAPGAIHPAVGETILRVQAFFHLQEQVRREPWTMLISALLMGYVIGSINHGHLLTLHHRHSEMRNPGLPQAAAAPALP